MSRLACLSDVFCHFNKLNTSLQGFYTNIFVLRHKTDASKKSWQFGTVLRPVAQLYGLVRTDWNQCFVVDCSLSHPAGHKPFTCSHSVLRNTWLNIDAVRWMRVSARLSVHVFTTSRNFTRSLFVSSAVSELPSAWSISYFLRYVCCCMVVKVKSLSVLMPFCVIKTSAELEAIKRTVSPLSSPACFVSLTL